MTFSSFCRESHVRHPNVSVEIFRMMYTGNDDNDSFFLPLSLTDMRYEEECGWVLCCVTLRPDPHPAPQTHYPHPLPTNVEHTITRTHPSTITPKYTHTFLFPMSSFYTTHGHGGSVWVWFYGRWYVFWSEWVKKYREIGNSGDRMCENHHQVQCVHTFVFTSFFFCVIRTQTIKVERAWCMHAHTQK